MEICKDNKNIGAPFSQTFYTDGKITAVNGGKATVEYRNKNGEIKSASFAINNPLGFEVGESVWVQTVDEFVFIHKSSGNPLFLP